MTRTLRRACVVRASADADVRLLRYRFLGYTEDHLAEGAFVLFREDDAWTAASFREELGCPDVLYQEVATRRSRGVWLWPLRSQRMLSMWVVTQFA